MKRVLVLCQRKAGLNFFKQDDVDRIKELIKTLFDKDKDNIKIEYMTPGLCDDSDRADDMDYKMEFGDFTIRFIINEDMSNYMELYNWLVALGFPKSYNQYESYTGQKLNRFPYVKNERGNSDIAAYSDGTLTILDSNNVPKTNILFKDLFPVSLEALDFDIASSSVEYFVGIASFRYKLFEIEPLAT